MGEYEFKISSFTFENVKNNSVLANHLILRRTTLLGYPYTDCTSNGNRQACNVVHSSERIETECGCRSAYFGDRHPKLRECNYTDMVLCGNKIVEQFIRDTKNEFPDTKEPESTKEPCRPECVSWGFDIDHVTYSDPVFHNEEILKNRFGLAQNMSIFSTELSLELSDLKVIDEEVVYTLGELISDVGGILGFFLGLSLLQCLTEIWRYFYNSAVIYWFRENCRLEFSKSIERH